MASGRVGTPTVWDCAATPAAPHTASGFVIAGGDEPLNVNVPDTAT